MGNRQRRLVLALTMVLLATGVAPWAVDRSTSQPRPSVQQAVVVSAGDELAVVPSIARVPRRWADDRPTKARTWGFLAVLVLVVGATPPLPPRWFGPPAAGMPAARWRGSIASRAPPRLRTV